MRTDNILNIAQRAFDIEIDALEKTKDSLDNCFNEIILAICACKGKVIITGMGKSGHIAAKLAATFSSLGTSSFYLHPAEALHGDLGMISEEDIIIAISYSGESDEIIRIIPSIKIIGAKLISISGNINSTLIKNSDISYVLPQFKEACYLGLAPTSSTTATLVLGDALAITISELKGFNTKDFGLYHPAGALGKKLITKVSDLMVCGDNIPLIKEDCLLTDAIVEMSKKGLGMVSIINDKKCLTGIITDGDLRRMLERKVNVYASHVKNVMIKNPVFIYSDLMAINALRELRERSINGMPVIDSNQHVVGTITLQLLIKAGLVL